MFFDPIQYPSMEKLIKSNSTVTQMWNPINLRNPEDGDDTFSGTSVTTRATRYKVPEQTKKKKTPWPLVRERTIPTDRPPLVDEI
jgi:hypothetical protein